MDVRLRGEFTVLSPLSHIGESISATSYLVQEPILQPDGSTEEVFVYSGNAWRGQLRDLAAEYMLDALGAPSLPLDMFHLLFSGGKIGGTQSVNIDQARQYRRGIPMIALWGGGIGNQILPGKLRVRNSYPVVAEAMPVLPRQYHAGARRVSYGSITFEKSFSRSDDAKDERLTPRIAAPEPQQAALLDTPGKPKKAREPDEAVTQMRMTVELVSPGTVLTTGIDVLDASDVELGCLVSALHRFARSPHIGGQANRGHGLVSLDYALINLDTGETQPFVTIEDGMAMLAPPAEEAKQTYDAYMRSIYDAYLGERENEVVALLGAKR